VSLCQKQFDIILSRPSRGSLESTSLRAPYRSGKEMFLTENEARHGPIVWRLGFRIDHSVDMHHNKRSSHVRWCWVMVVGGARSNDMRCACSLSVRQMSISEPGFPYHSLAASPQNENYMIPMPTEG